MNPALLNRLIAGEHLAAAEAHSVMAAIMAGRASEAQIAAVLVALRAKGETVDEIAGCARAMRETAVPLPTGRSDLVDTCGTGGDGAGTFNISTATGLVCAAMGIPVAKHGNRAVSSRCGSADVLEALGIAIDLPPAAVAELLDETNFGFMFAPLHHPAMRHAAPVRRQLGIRTVFNLLGPLTNPAGARRQLLGVYDAALTEPIARVLGALGSERALVVHGHDGSDEISATGPTRVSELRDGTVRTYEITPEVAGLPRVAPADLGGGDAATCAAIVRGILAGERGPARDAVLLNAAHVAVLAERASDPAAGARRAAHALDSGAGRALLARLQDRSRRLAERKAS